MLTMYLTAVFYNFVWCVSWTQFMVVIVDKICSKFFFWTIITLKVSRSVYTVPSDSMSNNSSNTQQVLVLTLMLVAPTQLSCEWSRDCLQIMITDRCS